jgi:hypothetical protein
MGVPLAIKRLGGTNFATMIWDAIEQLRTGSTLPFTEQQPQATNTF